MNSTTCQGKWKGDLHPTVPLPDEDEAALSGTFPGISSLLSPCPFSSCSPDSLTDFSWEHFLNKLFAHDSLCQGWFLGQLLCDVSQVTSLSLSPPLQTAGNNCPHFMQVLWGLNKIMCVALSQHLACIWSTINVIPKGCWQGKVCYPFCSSLFQPLFSLKHIWQLAKSARLQFVHVSHWVANKLFTAETTPGVTNSP